MHIACLQLIKGTSLVISINKSVIIINVYDGLAKGCHHYRYLITKTFWDYSYKISQHEKKSFLYYLIQVQVHVYSNHWNIFNQIFNNPSPTIAPPQKHYHLKLYEEFSLIYTLYREKMMYVNNIRDKMPLVHCTDHVMFLLKGIKFFRREVLLF